MLNNIYWIGGSSGAAKSTLARRLASEYNMILYSTDETMRDHGQRCTPEERPLLDAFKSMSMDERWANRTPQAMFDTFQWFHGEGFRFIIEDLMAMPEDKKVLVEGFRLLPRLVKPHVVYPHQAIWLISTPEFRLKAFTDRGTLWKIPNKTTKPKKALQNHLARESLFANHLTREVQAENVPSLKLDGSLSEHELLDAVASLLKLKFPTA